MYNLAKKTDIAGLPIEQEMTKIHARSNYGQFPSEKKLLRMSDRECEGGAIFE